MLSISLLLNPGSPLCGIPSTINNGVLLPLIEFIPRIWILAAEPGAPELDCTLTPAICPCKAVPRSEVLIFVNDSDSTRATAPVNSFLRIVP